MRVGCLVAALLLALVPSARACELCGGLDADFTSLQERVERWPMVAMGTPVGRTREGRMQFRIDQVLKGDRNLRVGAKVAPRGMFAALPGHLWLLLGRKANFHGGTVLMLRPATLAFLREAPRLPSAGQPAARLVALAPWLTHEDPMVRASARKAFAAAPYAVLKKAAGRVAADDLVATLSDPERAPRSRGALFLLLGHAGGPAHRKLLAAWMRDPAMQRAAGFDALLAAWLVGTGPEGVDSLHALLDRPGSDAVAVGSAIVRALGFHGRHDVVVPRARVLASLRTLITRRSLAPAVIDELARLAAWDDLARVVEAWRRHGADDDTLTASTLRYLDAHPGEAARPHALRLRAALAKRRSRGG